MLSKDAPLEVNSVNEISLSKSETGKVSIENPLVSSQGGMLFIIARVKNADATNKKKWNYEYTTDKELGLPAILIQYTQDQPVPQSDKLYIITINNINFNTGEEVAVEVDEDFWKKKPGPKIGEEPTRKTIVIV